MKSTTLARQAFHPDFPAHDLCETLRDGQSQSRTAVLPGGRTVSLRKSFKDQLLLLDRNTNSRITNDKMS